MTTDVQQTVTRAPRFFYGWVIVVVSFLAQFGGTFSGNYALTVLLVPMSQDTGWTLTQIVGVNVPASITSALVSPYFGRLAARYGSRGPMVIAGVLGGLTMIAVAWVHELWLYYLIFGLVNGISRPMVQVIGISQGVAQWFVRRRSAAAGMVSIAIPISGLVGVQITTLLYLHFGWRTTWGILGVVLIAVVALPIWFFWRERPEDMGLLPDGDAQPVHTEASREQAARAVAPRGRFAYYQTAIEWTADEARRTRTFWVLAIVPPAIALVGPAMTTLVIAYFRSRGLGAQTAAIASASFVGGTFAARFIWGILGSRLHIQYCYVALGLIAIAGTVLLIVAPSIILACGAASLCGMAAGGLLQLRLLIWPNYFGREAIATLRGYSAPFEITGGTLGPVLAAWVFDHTGSYNGALVFYAVVSAIGVAVMIALGGPPKPPVRAGVEAASEPARAG